MAIIRLTSGGLFVWSPVALTVELTHDVQSLGPVEAIVAPNSLHHLYVQEWKDTFPNAKVFAAPGVRGKRRDIAIDHELADQPPPEWTCQIDQAVFRGNLITTEIVFFHRASGTVLVTDLLQQFAPDWLSGWRSAIAWLDGLIAATPQTPKKFRLAQTDRKAGQAALEIIMAWPAQNLIVAHGEPIRAEAKRAIERAFSWIVGNR
jgi:hypothetical protein